MEKLKNQFTINLDDETAETLEALARELQRKPRELLRLLVAPVIRKEWERVNAEKFPENKEPPKPAHFVPSWLDKLPKL